MGGSAREAGPTGSAITLIHGAFIYTANSNHDIYPDGAVIISDGRVAAVGSTISLTDQFEDIRRADTNRTSTKINARGKLLFPGFVNPHWHEGSIQRLASPVNCVHTDRSDPEGPFGCGGDLHSLSQRFDHAHSISRSLDEGEAYSAALFNLMTQLKSGTTCLGDVGSVNTSTCLAAAARAVGVRLFVSLWASDGVCAPGENRFARTRDTDALLAEMETLCDRYPATSELSVSAMPTVIYISNMSDELGEGLATIVRQKQIPYATHIGALRNEATFSRAVFGRSSVERFHELGLLSERFLAVHMAFATDEEADLLVAAKVKLTHSPAKYGCAGEESISGSRLLLRLRQRGLPLSISTDGEAVALGMMPEAMRAAYLGHNEASASRIAVRASDALAMATREAAACLGIEREVGSIEQGKRADIVLVRADDWRYAASLRPLDVFLNLGSCRDVDTVFVGGQVLVENGRCTRLNEEAVTEAYVRACTSFAARAG